MKMKPQYLFLIILLVGVVATIFFLRPESIMSLFSQSINGPAIYPGVPAVQSLDNQAPVETRVDFVQQIELLEQELLKTENDPDKALEIRRRLQILRDEAQKNAS